MEVSQRYGVAEATHLETIKRLIQKADFSKEVADSALSHLNRSMAYLYQGKWSRFFHWCRGRNIAPAVTRILSLSAKRAEAFFLTSQGL